MAELILENLVKRFGKTEVVHGISLDMHDLEFVVLVGPSGCGKSTILRMVAGLEKITSGTVRVDGKVINDLAPKDRSMAMVFQNYALYPHMNVFGNMAFGLKLNKTPKAEIKQRVQRTAEILDMQDLLRRKPHELSGGQRQRVAMGRAMVRNPSIFLFDEPLSNLDAKLRNQMRTEIKRLHQRVKANIIYVTHDQVEAMTLADRIVVLRDGHIEQVGQPLELFQKPANTFVAGFIGSPPMNLVNARLRQENGQFNLEFDGGLTIPVPPKEDSRLADGLSVTMGIRTEDLTIDDGNGRYPDNWKVDGIVEVVEPLGGETHMHMNLMGPRFVGKCEGRRRVRPDDKLKLILNLDHLHIFNAESTAAIY